MDQSEEFRLIKNRLLAALPPDEYYRLRPNCLEAVISDMAGAALSD